MKTLIFLATLLSFQLANASIVTSVLKAKLENVSITESQCLHGINEPDEMQYCLDQANAGYYGAMVAISGAFLGAFSEKTLLIADSENKWAEYAKSTCELSSASMNQVSTSSARAYTKCMNKKLHERALELIEIYEAYMANQ